VKREADARDMFGLREAVTLLLAQADQTMSTSELEEKARTRLEWQLQPHPILTKLGDNPSVKVGLAPRLKIYRRLQNSKKVVGSVTPPLKMHHLGLGQLEGIEFNN
jgi:hypothetical protein